MNKINPLKASLNLLDLNLVIEPTGTSNGSFGAWIASDFQNIFYLFSLENTLKKS